jgi:hypothetical protein
MIQIDVTKSNAEMPPNLPQKLISLFKIPEIHVQTEFSTQDRVLTATLRSNDCHGPNTTICYSPLMARKVTDKITTQDMLNFPPRISTLRFKVGLVHDCHASQ